MELLVRCMHLPSWTGLSITPLWTMRSWFSAAIWKVISDRFPARTAELKAIPNFIVSELSIKSTDTQLAFCFFIRISVSLSCAFNLKLPNFSFFISWPNGWIGVPLILQVYLSTSYSAYFMFDSRY